MLGRASCWEPSWEPFAVDLGGRLRTLVDSEALRSNAAGWLWTLVDGSWGSTDQKVGGSSPSGRAAETPAAAGVSAVRNWGAQSIGSRWPAGAVRGRQSSSRNASMVRLACRRMERNVSRASSRCSGTITVLPAESRSFTWLPRWLTWLNRSSSVSG